jgi:phosphate-selective porin OprO/OprP
MLGEPSGPGALQLAARWSTVDIDSGTERGGRPRDTTLALNGYLSEDLRVMAGFTTGYVEALAEGPFRVLQSRLLYRF